MIMSDAALDLEWDFSPCTLHFGGDNHHDPTFGAKPIESIGTNLSIVFSFLMTGRLEASSFLDSGP